MKNSTLKEITIEDVFYYICFETKSIYYRLGMHGALSKLIPSEDNTWLFDQCNVRYYIPACDI